MTLLRRTNSGINLLSILKQLFLDMYKDHNISLYYSQTNNRIIILWFHKNVFGNPCDLTSRF